MSYVCKLSLCDCTIGIFRIKITTLKWLVTNIVTTTRALRTLPGVYTTHIISLFL